MQRRMLNWREFLAEVNLRDFAGMVWAELGMIGTSARLAVESVLKLPFGPFLLVGGLFLALLRLVLLVLVVATFGTAIVVISAVRTVMALLRPRSTTPPT